MTKLRTQFQSFLSLPFSGVERLHVVQAFFRWRLRDYSVPLTASYSFITPLLIAVVVVFVFYYSFKRCYPTLAKKLTPAMDASNKADSEIQFLRFFLATGNDKGTVRSAGPTTVKAAQSRCGLITDWVF